VPARSRPGGGERFTSPLALAFPGIESFPRARLGRFPSPVESVELPDCPPLWLKRDDLNAAELGGNKVRALEFLLGGVEPGATVLTLGGEGSTHVLATAWYARRLGARTVAVRWRHEMNPVALRVRDRAAALCDEIVTTRSAAAGFARALLLRVTRRVRWVPLGGSSPLGTLGHVNAALELAEQIRTGLAPRPSRIVVPLGTGGTAAGLAVGLAISGVDATVVGARVGPRPFVSRAAVLALASRTRRLLARATGETIPPVERARVQVVHHVYGGAYGRPLAAGDRAAATLHAAAGLTLDATYGAKAAAAAIELARRDVGPVMLWVTFDGRWMNA
jgi:D-cysteine desulfhydrase